MKKKVIALALCSVIALTGLLTFSANGNIITKNAAILLADGPGDNDPEPMSIKIPTA